MYFRTSPSSKYVFSDNKVSGIILCIWYTKKIIRIPGIKEWVLCLWASNQHLRTIFLVIILSNIENSWAIFCLPQCTMGIYFMKNDLSFMIGDIFPFMVSVLLSEGVPIAFTIGSMNDSHLVLWWPQSFTFASHFQ